MNREGISCRVRCTEDRTELASQISSKKHTSFYSTTIVSARTARTAEVPLTSFDLSSVVTTKAPRPDRDGKQRYLISRRVSTEASPHLRQRRSDLFSFAFSRYLSISFSSKRLPSPNLLSLDPPAPTCARIDLPAVLNLRLLLPLTPLKTPLSSIRSPSSRWGDSTVSSTSTSILQHND